METPFTTYRMGSHLRDLSQGSKLSDAGVRENHIDLPLRLDSLVETVEVGQLNDLVLLCYKQSIRRPVWLPFELQIPKSSCTSMPREIPLTLLISGIHSFAPGHGLCQFVDLATHEHIGLEANIDLISSGELFGTILSELVVSALVH
jgi:hypothetical protein